MNGSKSILMVCTLGLLLPFAKPSSALAQAAKSPLSDSKAIAELPERITFMKTYSHRPPPSSGQNAGADDPQKAELAKFLKQFDTRLAKIVVEKTGIIRREFLSYLTGVNVERWVNGNIKFWIHSGQPSQIEVSLPGMYEEDPTAGSDFNELSWVTPNDFKENATLGSSLCKVYRRGDKAAWIMETSQLPLKFESPEMSITYTYGPAPEQDLVLPGKFTDRHKQVMDAWTGRTR